MARGTAESLANVHAWEWLVFNYRFCIFFSLYFTNTIANTERWAPFSIRDIKIDDEIKKWCRFSCSRWKYLYAMYIKQSIYALQFCFVCWICLFVYPVNYVKCVYIYFSFGLTIFFYRRYIKIMGKLLVYTISMFFPFIEFFFCCCLDSLFMHVNVTCISCTSYDQPSWLMNVIFDGGKNK